MPKKPVYHHPDFVTSKNDKRIELENKRLWLSLTIDEKCKEGIVVILKNPSRATKDISDKTVYTVTNYIYKNREKFEQLKNVGTVIILNLIPFYQTESDKLVTYGPNIIDRDNLKAIRDFTTTYNKVIIAWGNHPKGLPNEYEKIKKSVLEILQTNNNTIYYIDKLSIQGNPKHGQVWKYKDEIKSYNK